MKRSALLVTAAIALASSPVVAGEIVLTGPAPEWVAPSELKPVPEDAAGLVFVRRQDTLVHLGKTGQSSYMSQHIRLLRPEALEAGNIALSWNPAAGSPTVHALRIHRDGAVIDVLANNSFEVLRREDQLERAMLDGMLTAILRVPDLRVGDELEWAFTTPSQDPTLGADSFGLLSFVPAPPSGRFRLGLSWDQGQKPSTRLTPDFEAHTRRDKTSLHIDLDEPGLLTPPKDAPPRFAWQRIVEYSDFSSWAEISKRFEPLYSQAARLEADSPLQLEASRIATAQAGAVERAQAALELVQQQVRYIYVGLEGGNLDPASADETWRRRYGDCKGKTALLLALLSELEIEAEPVLVNASGLDDGFDERLPNPGLFDHVLVRAHIGGQTYWLDGTMPVVVEMKPAPILPFRWVLPLAADGNELEHVAQAPAELPDEMGLFEIDAREGFDQHARKVHTSVKRGIDGVVQYAQLSTLTPSQLKQGMQNAAGEDWAEIDDVSYRYDRRTQASILTISGKGPVDWDEEGGGARSLVLPGGGFSPPNQRQRPSGQDQTAPYYNESGFSCYATTVRLPADTDLENWGFNSVFDTMIFGRIYYRMMEKRSDKTIRLVRGSRVERREIEADTARRDNARLDDFDNSKADITYDPGRTMDSWGSLRPVPATYEIDWTGSDVPCLPRDVL